MFLASNIGGIKKDNERKIPVQFLEKNEFLANLKKYIKRTKKFVLISSDPNNYENNDLYLKIDIEALKLSGLIFEEYLVLDRRNKNNVSDVLLDSDLIFLCGGDTLMQNNFFNSINLKKYLKDINSVIVGISAGSINAATEAYNSPLNDLDLKQSPCLKGLGLTKINIEPHFVLDDLSTNNKRLQRKDVLRESYNRNIVALSDNAYILQTDEYSKLYGESYLIKKGIINKLCNDDESVTLNEILNK